MSTDNTNTDETSTDEAENVYMRPKKDRNDFEKTKKELKEMMVTLKRINARHHYSGIDFRLVAAYTMYTLGAMRRYADRRTLPKGERRQRRPETQILIDDMYQFTDDEIFDKVMSGKFRNGRFDIDVDINFGDLDE